MKKTAAERVFANGDPAKVGAGLGEFALFCRQRAEESEGGMNEFRQHRIEFEHWMENDFTGRIPSERDNIFSFSNETLGMVRGQIGFVVSRVQDDLFGSAPFFAVMPEGEKAQDTVLADKLFKHANWKLGMAGWERLGLQIVERCFNFGEAIVRTGWRTDVWRSFELKTVLVRGGRAPGTNGADDQGEEAEPVMTAAGEHVTPEDQWGDGEQEHLTSNDEHSTLNGEGATGDEESASEDAGEQQEEEEQPSASGDASEVGWRRGAMRRVTGDTPRKRSAVSGQQSEDADNADNADGRDARATGGAAFLKKDPAIVMEGGMRFEEVLVPRVETRYEGLDPKLIDWRNFRCAANFARIEDADFRGHYYEMRWSELRRKIEAIRGPEETWDEETVALVNSLRGQGPDAKDETRKTGPDASSGTGDVHNPLIKCLDCEIEYDPEKQGRTAWFFATVLPDLGKVVFVDYLSNVLPEGESTYSVISVYNPPNRWHGRGWWEIYKHAVFNSDRLWNLLLRQGELSACPITGVDENLLEDAIEDIEIVPGVKIRLKPGADLAKALQFIQMPDANEGRWKMLQFLMTNTQLETGVTSAAQGGVGQLPATNTATGIQSVLSSGSTLVKRPEKDIAKGIEGALKKEVGTLYAYQDKAETFRYGEGENEMLVQLTPEDVLDLEVRVKLLMTRGRARDRVETARTAIGVVLEYLNVPEAEKAGVRPLFIEVLKGLEVQNPEGLIRPPLPAPTKPDQPPVPAIVMNFKDLPPEAQVQVMAQHGIVVSVDDVKAAVAATSKPKGSGVRSQGSDTQQQVPPAHLAANAGLGGKPAMAAPPLPEDGDQAGNADGAVSIHGVAA